MRSLKMLAALAAVGLSVAVTSRAHAAADSSATISTVSSGATNSYSVTLNNDASSTVPIQTFWFSWIPGQDYMATSPLTVSNPPGWTDRITHGGANDGFAIQWVASTTASDVTAGSSLSGFGFTSTDTPASLDGDSVFFPTTPVLTSFTYSSTPLSGTAEQFVVAPAAVPEPATLGLIAPAAMMVLRRNRRFAK
jgi:hypothetical protein